MLTIDELFFITPVTNELKRLINYKWQYTSSDGRQELLAVLSKLWRIEAYCKSEILDNQDYPSDEVQPRIINEYIERFKNSPHVSKLPDTLYDKRNNFPR